MAIVRGEIWPTPPAQASLFQIPKLRPDDGKLVIDQVCPTCGEDLTYVRHAYSKEGKKVCLESTPVVSPLSLADLYRVDDGLAFPVRFSWETGPFYFCHTARDGHQGYARRSK